MKDTNLGSRLLMAASFVKNGDTVCDVGCDHGKLGLYLIQTGRAKKIIATDINIKPLNKAVKLFEENGFPTSGISDLPTDCRVLKTAIKR